jgi:hypothetical protein
LRNLLTAIEAYKEKHGFYPPDNPKEIAHPPLFYELIGTRVENNTYYPLNGAPALTSAQIKNNFDTDGFLNSGPEASEVKNFYTTAKTNTHYIVSPFSNDRGIALRVPARGPKHPTVAEADLLITWRYIVARPQKKPGDRYPTNNPASFDLWAEVVIRGRTVTIGNWKEE